MSEPIKLPLRTFSVPGLDGVSFMAHYSMHHDGFELKAAFTFYYVEQVPGVLVDSDLADCIPRAAKALREGISAQLEKWEIRK